MSMTHPMGLAAPVYAEHWLPKHLCIVVTNKLEGIILIETYFTWHASLGMLQFKADSS